MTYDEILKYHLKRLEKAFPESKNTIGLTKVQLAHFKKCSIATINRAIKDSDSTVIPNYIKGKGKNGRVYFSHIDTAIYLAKCSVKMA